ncbi:MAG: hypothetical protein HY905_11260 [Deltaproteobacteria bacterium]|nr:hypothetical protein [Deltaproteobacteria bacterium]
MCSEDAWNAFRTAFAAEYAALDAKCSGWTVHEAELGRLAPAAIDAVTISAVREFAACINRHDVAALGKRMYRSTWTLPRSDS